jgi:hypothetical protein
MAYLPEKPSVLPPSELVRLLGHLVLGGITCFGLGAARLRVPRWPLVLAGGFALGATWHFLWDWIAFMAWERGSMKGWQTLAGVGLMLSGMLVYGTLVIAASERSRLLFAPHSRTQLWGWPFTLWRRNAAPFRPGGERGRDS